MIDFDLNQFNEILILKSDKSETFFSQEAYKIFSNNRKRIDTHNERYFACNVSYALGLWKNSDLNDSEVNYQLNGLAVALEGRSIFVGGYDIQEANVTYLNYAEMGYVTRVFDQGRILP